MDEWVSVCESGEGTCWILGIKQLLREADGGETLWPCVHHWDILILNDERCRKGLVLSFTGAQESRRKLPLRTGWFLVGYLVWVPNLSTPVYRPCRWNIPKVW